MIIIKTIDDLPQPVRLLARNFYESDANEPEVYEVVASEYDKLARGGDSVTQLLYWRREHKFYAVLAGDAERKIQSKHVIHDPYYKNCAILVILHTN